MQQKAVVRADVHPEVRRHRRQRNFFTEIKDAGVFLRSVRTGDPCRLPLAIDQRRIERLQLLSPCRTDEQTECCNQKDASHVAQSNRSKSIFVLLAPYRFPIARRIENTME